MQTKAWKGTLRVGAGTLLLGALAACGGSSVERNGSNDETGGAGGTGLGGTGATGGASAGTTGGSAGEQRAGSGGAAGAPGGSSGTAGMLSGGSSGTAGMLSGGSSGTAGMASGGGSGAAGASGAAGDGGEGGSPDCVPVGDSTHPDECPELERLVLSDPRIDDSSGDGRVSPGERFTLHVLERDVSGLGHSGYPGVVYSTDDPNLEFVPDAEDFDRFALLACGSYESKVDIIVGDVPLDTVVNVTARAGSLNRECPDAPSLVIPIHVQ